MSILFKLILAVHAILALALVGIILLQRSEGGVLGIGGGSSGLMTARGAADLLTRATRWLAVGFISTSIGLAVVAARDRKGDSSVATEMSATPAKTADKTAPANTPPALPAVPMPGLDMRLPDAPPPAAAVPAPAAPATSLPASNPASNPGAPPQP